MNPFKLTSLLLIVSALMSFGCAASNPNTMPLRTEQVQATEANDQDVPWEWQVVYWVVGIGGSFAAGKNEQ
jgi:hypothetical protein